MLLKVKEPYHRQSEISALINDWEKISYWEEFKESESLADKYDSFHNVSSWRVGVMQHSHRKNLQFIPSFMFGNSIFTQMIDITHFLKF